MHPSLFNWVKKADENGKLPDGYCRPEHAVVAPKRTESVPELVVIEDTDPAPQFETRPEKVKGTNNQKLYKGVFAFLLLN
jgi:hypothetical protein